MKISDPLGKVYTHTMFKKRGSHEGKEGGGGGRGEYSSRRVRDEEEGAIVDRDAEEEEEEDEDEEDGDSIGDSERSEDSLSTRSSRLAANSRENMMRQSVRRPLSTVSLKLTLVLFVDCRQEKSDVNRIYSCYTY